VSFAFAGTPLFAARVLRDLVDMGRHPALVISQPDRPRGRGQCGSPPESASQAKQLGIECVQTEDINSPVVFERLRALGVSTLVVAAFGQLLREPLLGSLCCLNIHASLLPKYRGAAPIERALAAGEALTGVTIMRVSEGLDEGPWAEQVQVSVGLRDDAGSLGRVLSGLGAVALVQVLDAIAEGTVAWKAQEGSSSYARKLGPQDCVLDTTAGARRVHDQVRALSPCIGARAAFGDLAVKVWRTWPYGQDGLATVPPEAVSIAGSPGTILATAGRLFVGCGEGVLEALVVQPASRARMTCAAFLRGYGERVGDRLAEVRPSKGLDLT
jgi:methionyl-tRNA formyltransferase